MRHRHRHPVNVAHHDEASVGERLADAVAGFIGSWRFLIGQAVFLAVWVTANTAHGWRHWDDFPYILLNLCLSVQAAVSGPLILLAGNRQAQKDRLMLEHTFDDAERSVAELLHNTTLTVEILRHVKPKESNGGSS